MTYTYCEEGNKANVGREGKVDEVIREDWVAHKRRLELIDSKEFKQPSSEPN